MKINGFEALSLERAQTLFRYTARYRYTDEVRTYLCRCYMVDVQWDPTHTGTMHKTPEEAVNDLHFRQVWLRREGRAREAEALTVIPHDFLTTVSKKRAYRLT